MKFQISARVCLIVAAFVFCHKLYGSSLTHNDHTITSDFSDTSTVVISTAQFHYQRYDVKVPEGKSAHVSFRRSQKETTTEWSKSNGGSAGHATVYWTGDSDEHSLSYSLYFGDNRTVSLWETDISSDASYFLLPVSGSPGSQTKLIGYFECAGNKMPLYVVADGYYYCTVGVQVKVTYTDSSASLESIAISGSSSITSGHTTSLTCTASYSNGSTKTVTPTWSITSGSSYATISSAGLFTAKTVSSKQTVTVKASYLGKTETKTITINPASPTLSSISINGATAITSGETKTLSCTAAYSDGSTKTVTPTWSVKSGSSYATISSIGELTAKSVSSAQTVIIQAVYSGKTSTKSITVNPASDSVKLSETHDLGHDYKKFTGSFTVTASSSWTLSQSVTESWLHVTKSGNTVSYTFDQNNTSAIRACTFTVTCGKASATCQVNQNGRTIDVVFDGNGGTINDVSTKTFSSCSIGTRFGGIKLYPIYSGYTFDGWYTSRTGGTKVSDETTLNELVTDSQTEITFYARWAKPTHYVSVTWDANGGEFEDGITTDCRSYDYSKTFGSIPSDPIWSGHTFIGWFTQKSGGTQVYETTSIPSVIGASVSSGYVYAQWTSDLQANLLFSKENAYPTWPQAMFVSSANNSAEMVTSFQEGDSIYAYCCFINGGNGSTEKDFIVINEVLDEDSNSLGCETNLCSALSVGYSVWWKGCAFGFLQNLPPGKYKYRCSLDRSGTVDELNENDNVAEFEFTVEEKVERTVVITWDANGGHFADNATTKCATKNASDRIGKIESPTNADLMFNGWYTDPDGGDEIHYWAVVSGIVATTEEAAHLYAHWTTEAVAKEKYTVTYRPGANGSGSDVTAKKLEGDELILEGAIFERDGYKQTGWSISDGGPLAYSLSASYTEDSSVTLYPYWTLNDNGYGPWGESEDVANPDKLGPTMLVGMSVTVDGKAVSQGDVVAVFRNDTSALCGLGKAIDDSGNVTVVCYAPAGVDLSFKVWIAASGINNPTICTCSEAYVLTAPAVGSIVDDCTLAARTAELAMDRYEVCYRDGNRRVVREYLRDKVYALERSVFAPPSGKTFAGWLGSNGRRYDDGVLFFNAISGGKTLTLTAIWK